MQGVIDEAAEPVAPAGATTGRRRSATAPTGRALAPDEREQAVIARAGEFQAAGVSLREIGATLEAEGHRPKREARWHPTAVAWVLRRPG